MSKSSFAAMAAAASVAFALACEQAPTAADSTTLDAPDIRAAARGPLVHHASVGGADACEALGLPTGCNANFSLVANEHADGSVSGQWDDTLPGGGEGLHIAVDCLNVAGNAAVIGGVVTHGVIGGVDVSGQRAITAAVDNGTSNSDPADQISFSFVGAAILAFFGTDDCTALDIGDFSGLLLDLAHGQVKVR